MQDTFTLNAKIRLDVGKGASRRLRHSDLIPAIIYGKGKEPINIILEHSKFSKALENEAFYTRVLKIKIDTQEEQVILRDLQRHPYKPRILHADFQRISAQEKIIMNIPLHFVGEDIAPGVKQKGGVISHLLSEVEVRCLPANLPEFIEVDLSQADIDEIIHLSNLKLPEGVEIVGLVADTDTDKPVVSIHMPRVVEEPVAAEAVSAEVETVAEAKAKEKEATTEEAKAK